MNLVFDIETDGLLDTLTTIWCLVVYDVDASVVTRYNNQSGGLSIQEGIQRLLKAERLIGHNILGFDIPAIERLYDVRFDRDKLWDTLVLCRMYNPERAEGHSLDSYGTVTGVPKHTWSDWTRWSSSMEDYCEQDVHASTALWNWIWHRVGDWGDCLRLEHSVAEIIALQMENGFTLDVQKASVVSAECLDEINKLEKELREIFPPCWKKLGERVAGVGKPEGKGLYVKGAPYTQVLYEEFNPASTQHIARRLKEKYGWRPRVFTETGAPKVDESVLSTLSYDSIPQLLRYIRVSKMWRQIAAPQKRNGSGGGWLHHVRRDSRVHGYVNTFGAVTGRMTHSRPNMANVDKKDLRLRAVWIPKPGWTLIGADADGLELRILAHYLATWDNGKYAEMVVSGRKEDATDAHSVTQKLLHLNNRDNAKRVIYALIYGAGDPKLGQIIREDVLAAGKELPKLSLKAIGESARYALEKGITGLSNLNRAIAQKVRVNGHLRGICGGQLRVRSPHVALNTLLQGGGATVMKKALAIFHETMLSRGHKHGKDFGYCANVHDEVQIEAPKELAEEIGKTFTDSIAQAGHALKLRCPLSGSYKIGSNWAETH